MVNIINNKTSRIFKFLLYLILTLNILGYEIHLYKDYSNFIKISSVFLLFILIIVFKNKKRKIEINDYIFILLFLFIVLLLITYYQAVFSNFTYLSYVSYIKPIIIITWITIALILLDVSLILLILDSFFKIGIILAILNILIYFNNGFLIWNKLMIVRGGSFFFDPNYWGAFNLFLILYFIFFRKTENFIKNLLIFLILIISLILSFSKSSMISFVITYIIYMFVKARNLLKKIIYTIVTIILSFGTYLFFKEIPFFRFQMGSNNRLNMWKYFFSEITNSPFIGFGEEGIKYRLVHANLVNYSFHNFIIDKTFSYGIFVGVIFFVLIIYTLYSLSKFDYKLSLLFFALFLNSNFIDYSLGGIGTNSFIFSLLMLLAFKINQRSKLYENCSYS